MLVPRAVVLLSICACLGVNAACSRPRPPSSATPPATARIESSVPFDGSAHGFYVSYPAGWSPEPSRDFVLMLEARAADGSCLSIDVPDLPPHIPGLIPLGLVVDGYLSDLRKLHADLTSSRYPPPDIPGADARMAISRWTRGGAEWEETAVLAVHADRVYIFRATYPSRSRAPTRIALNEMLDSLRWTN